MIPTLILGIRQRDVELVPARVTESLTGNAALPEGFNHFTFTKNGTGDYTLTLKKPGRRAMVVVGVSPLTANLQHQIVSVSASVVNVKFTNNSGTATNTDFHISVLKYGSDKQY